MVGRISAWVVGVLITGLYIVTIVAAFGNLLMFPQMAAAGGFEVSAPGWWRLGLGVALPVIVYVVALVLARKRKATTRLLVLLAGLALVSAVQLEVNLLLPQSGFLV
ncbi:MAG: hypothetical protein WDA07_05195 [Leucobacter sp.]